jgi:AraC family transcriptional regulator
MNPGPAAGDAPVTTKVRFFDSGSQSKWIRVALQADPAGIVEMQPQQKPLVAIHVGRPVYLECRHGNKRHAGLAIHGDIDIIPSRISASWEMHETDTALIISISPELLSQLASESGFDVGHLELRDRFQIRDPQIEHIGWALKAEIEQGYPGGPRYFESMATALGIQLLRNHSSLYRTKVAPEPANGRLPSWKLKQLLTYIEHNLSEHLSLEDIANAGGLSVSHLKTSFHKSMGMPVHQYVVRRRVERAALLLQEGNLSVSQIALEAGFSHQSHLARHMRRVLGVSPRDLSKRAVTRPPTAPRRSAAPA